ncbi:hypothetical protein GCM10010174_50050 [Kutzneria viridogrisea]|uniref:Methyltransferase domain-containing protein n=2 Tax=Kutzneria TaxID=43356 RepID=W5WEQ9_9PSEU|nr:methyltransferase domain-containing protein [Kutzneria albida]AHH99245.1 hypothetical protein KALB_5884 [Kutzneria albida DSM 43870]MBA8923201.1 cyclopropane fatty-acyl-phospholipid synthase-like methyltransferase [Kutzneria viridogrisea]
MVRWFAPSGSGWSPRLFELYFTRFRSGVGFRQQEQRAVLDALEPRLAPGQRVLELGSGTGHYTLALHERGARVHARDASPAMVDYLVRRVAREAPAGIDAGFGRFPDDLRVRGTFDGVLTVGMVNYVQDLPAAFTALAALLVPGGWLVFNVPRADRSGRRYARLELLTRRRAHLRAPGEVEHAVTAAGLRLAHGPVDAGITSVYRCEAPLRHRPSTDRRNLRV